MWSELVTGISARGRAHAFILACAIMGGCARGPESALTERAAGEDLIDLLAQTNSKIEQFQFSPDGHQIAYVSSQNGSSDVWVMNSDGTNAHAITSAYPEAVADPQWSPDGKWIAYASRSCGTGCWTEIFMTPSDGSGPPINLSYGLGGPTPQWMRDGKSIAFVRYYGDNGYSRIGILQADIPIGRPSVRYPTNSPSNEGDPQPSPDGKWLAFTATRSERANGPLVSGVWVAPIAGGDPRLVIEASDSPQWSPDSTRITFVSSRGAKARNIGVVEVSTREAKILTHDDWDDGNPRWSPDGHAIAFVANRKWNFYLMSIPATGGAARQLTDRPGVSGGVEGSNVRGTFRWAPDGRSIVYTFMDHGLPSDLWQIPAAGGTPKRLTNHLPATLRSHRFVAPELVSYKSKDGRDVWAYLFKPTDLGSNQKAPLLLYAHSFGDGGMFVNGFYPFIQYFVSRGFVVLAPEDAKRGDFGGIEIDDLVSGIGYLDTRGLIDRNRVVMQGGSTGGYRTMQTAVRFPGLLKAAVNLYGPTNVVALQKFYEGTRRRALFGGNDRSLGLEHWKERSATYNLDRITTPILLLWADRDLGVPTSQADEYFRLARQKGVPVEYVPYRDESHGWYTWRPETLKDAIQRIAAHYDKYLGR